MSSRYARQLAPELQSEFDSFYAIYPRKEGPRAAQQAFASARKRVSFQQISDGLALSMRFWAAQGTARQFIPHPTTWLNQDRCLNEYSPDQLVPPPPKPDKPKKGDNSQLMDDIRRQMNAAE